MIFFSIVIPLYNKENFIKDTLDSVFNQTFKDFEIIIVNDESTDRSLNVAKSFNDERIQIFTINNQGVSHARNFGINKSKGEYIALLDADDIWYPNHLEDLKNLIKSFPNCGLYCTGYETSFYGKKIMKGRFLGINNPFVGIVPNYFESSLINSIASGSSVCIPKLIFEKYGDFNLNMRSGQDTELWIRISLKEMVAFTSHISTKIIISNPDNHLSMSNKRIDRLLILEQFIEQEKTNKSLKRYMDLNRFSIAIERKLNGDSESFEKIIAEIDYSNLNSKQKRILKLPAPILKLMKQIQVFLIKNKIYLSPFR